MSLSQRACFSPPFILCRFYKYVSSQVKLTGLLEEKNLSAAGFRLLLMIPTLVVYLGTHLLMDHTTGEWTFHFMVVDMAIALSILIPIR